MLKRYLLLCVFMSFMPCWAGYVVLKNGKVIKTLDMPVKENQVLRFKLENGSLVKMPMNQINLEATDQANQDPDAFADKMRAHRDEKRQAADARQLTTNRKRPKPMGGGQRPVTGFAITKDSLQENRTRDQLATKLSGVWEAEAHDLVAAHTQIAVYPSGRCLLIENGGEPIDFTIHPTSTGTELLFESGHDLAGSWQFALAPDRGKFTLTNSSVKLDFKRSGQPLPDVSPTLASVRAGSYVYEHPVHWRAASFSLADGTEFQVLTNRLTNQSFALGRGYRRSSYNGEEAAFVHEILNVMLKQLDDTWTPHRLNLAPQARYQLKLGPRYAGNMSQYGFQALGERMISHIVWPRSWGSTGHFILLFSDNGQIPPMIEEILSSQMVVE